MRGNLKAVGRGVGQVSFFVLFSWLMNRLMELFRLNIPGSLAGIVVLFVLLQAKIIKIEWIDLGAKWLIAEMLLFFIPSAVGIVQYKALILDSGFRVLIVVVLSITVVMAATGLLADRLAGDGEAAGS